MELQRFVKQRNKGEFIAIGGGKGGVGKTNVAVNLAIALGQRHQKVCLVDADLGLANVGALLGMRSKLSMHDVIEGRCEVTDILERGPGFLIAPGVHGISAADLGPEQRARVRNALDALQFRFDYLIVDTMAGIGPATIAFCIASSRTIVVTTPEPTAVIDAYASIKMMVARNAGLPISLLVNMADDRRQAFETYNSIARVTKPYLGMTPDFPGYIPFDQAVRRSVLSSMPWRQDSRAFASMGFVAAHLLGEEPKPRESGFAAALLDALSLRVRREPELAPRR